MYITVCICIFLYGNVEQDLEDYFTYQEAQI